MFTRYHTVHRHTVYLLCGFLGIRLLSFWLTPFPFILSVIAFIVLLIFGSLFYYRPELSWLFLVTEFLLGGTGHLLELGFLSLRTILVITFVSLWYTKSFAKGDLFQHIRELAPSSYVLILFLLFVGFSFFRGIFVGNDIVFVVRDSIPYFFCLLLYPAAHFLKQEKNYPYYFRLFTAFILGSALFSLMTFVLFSTGFAEIHGPYYVWFRDIVGGKITDLGEGFFRIVTPEHLLILPLLLVLLSRTIGDTLRVRPRVIWTVIVSAMLILVLNFSRTYMIGLGIGLLVLLYRHTFLSWGKVAFATVGIFFVLFIGIYGIASGGTSLGLDLLGFRFAAVARPAIEVSTATRSTLLSPIFDLIRSHPILGHGLGTVLTFRDPVTHLAVTTTQFDWGYFELWAELGFFGLAVLSVLLFIFFRLLSYISQFSHLRSLSVGLLAAFVSLCVMEVITPIFSHVFGVMLLVFLLGYLTPHYERYIVQRS
ncbi:MAG: hypothetical protein GW939_04430 [Candidatus Magasanikbacteria bacterium]|nr:hypothetical protein [Candidatus Magasanikbacteria bacterium]NCS72308.1 hypothetical protein [Candidatus Magasanikbacteria bacterium]